MVVVSNVLFATTALGNSEDEVYNSIMKVLLRIQKYSWPVAVIIFIYAIYQYYIIGSEAFEYKVAGQRLILGLSVFMTILQSLPLIYAIIIVQ
jgi:hypothetical protein